MDSITPSPLVGIGVMGRRPGPGVNGERCTPKPPHPNKGGEGVRNEKALHYGEARRLPRMD